MNFQLQREIVELLLKNDFNTSLKGQYSAYSDCYHRKRLMGTPLDYAKQLAHGPFIQLFYYEPETLPWMHKGQLCVIL